MTAKTTLQPEDAAHITSLVKDGRTYREIRDLGYSWRVLSAWATDTGYVWPRSRPRRAATTVVPKPLADYERARENGSIRHIAAQVDELRSNNGRVHFAQLLRDARAASDEGWEIEKVRSIRRSVAYLQDLLRILNEEDYFQRVCTGWEGRDDIPEQQLDTAPPALFSVRSSEAV